MIQFLQFQEDNLGKNVPKAPMTRIPVIAIVIRLCLQLKRYLHTGEVFYGLQAWRSVVSHASNGVQI